MLWVYGDLSNVERICINSFIAHGYHLTLWTYGHLSNAPEGMMVEDARNILPENRIFKYPNGSYAGFSNLFRYALLSKSGGLWVDTDVVCLVPAQALGGEAFLVTERVLIPSRLRRRFINYKMKKSPGKVIRYVERHYLKMNSNVIYIPEPKRGDIIDLAFAVSDRFPPGQQEWGDCGPKLLTALTLEYPKLAYKVMGPDFANSIDYWNCPQNLLARGNTISGHAVFLHLYNEMWRRAGVDKNGEFPKDSIMDALKKKYL